MAQKTLAQLTTEINNVITSQTSPDGITPATLGQLLQDIADSYWNQLDDVTPIGSSTGNLEDFLATIQSQVNAIIMPPLSDINLFRASKTIDQVLPTASGNFEIYFDDDVTAPNFDNSNQFYQRAFVAVRAMSKKFIAEKVVLYNAATGNDTYRLRILKNGTEIATSATITSTTDTDVYGHQPSDAEGYEFPPVITPIQTLIVGDVITYEIVRVHLGGGTMKVKGVGIASNA